ncbi:acyl-CoA dehydrogenase family protein, partial [Streptomyces aureocirculatus]|uniref:acyl-CoA dehydrogenase family protein n=1 Tax=Streptomyces aureocirculatus TaxID=67275 RepID=UPI0004C587EE
HLPLPPTALLQAPHSHLDPHGTHHTTIGNPRKRFLRTLNRVTLGKLCMSAACLGMARTALTTAITYAHNRHINGPHKNQRIPLTAHRTHHQPLLTHLATTYALTLLHRTTLTQYTHHTQNPHTTPHQRDTIERQIALTKAITTWQCRTIAIEARERCGAQGLFPYNNLTEQQLNIEGGITAEGDNLVITTKAASEMLFNHQPPPPPPPTQPHT